jgi:predicted AAA+ superfamily ATPase
MEKIISLSTRTVYEITVNKNGENNMPCPECSPNRRKKHLKCFSYNHEKEVGYCSHCETRFVKYESSEPKIYHKPEPINFTKLGKQLGVHVNTVQTYFEILEDTLLCKRIPGWSHSVKKQLLAAPKFYFFDSGVARASSGLIYEEIDNVWRGHAFETYILHEVKSYNHYHKKNRELFYYKAAQSEEIDLLIELQKKTMSKQQEFLAIEIKYSKKWDSRWSKILANFKNQSPKIKKTVGVYMGSEILTQQNVTVYPVEVFLEKLSEGYFF